MEHSLLTDERLNGLVAQCGFRITLNDATLVAKTQDAKTLRVITEWLFGPCTGHGACRSVLCDDVAMEIRGCPRYLCPSCMAELKERK